MVRGIDVFREWFKGYDEQYTIIGGAACDLLMTEEGLDFRATKDIDMVLILEMLNANFGKTFWKYVVSAGYEHCNKSTGNPQFYRFTNPKSKEYPQMIELFSRKPDSIILPEEAVLSPLSIEESISSLSAILLDDDYYDFLKEGRVSVDGITVLDVPFLIAFKAKAWLDLSSRRLKGEHVDSKVIRKHKNDVFRLTELLNPNANYMFWVPDKIKDDMDLFLEQMQNEEVDLRQLGIKNRTKEDILKEFERVYDLEGITNNLNI